MHSLTRIIALALSMTIAAAASAGQIEIKLKDGSKWRGQANDTVAIEYLLQGAKVAMEGRVTKVDDLYIVVNGTFAGQAAQKPIFKADIVSMKTISTAADAGDSAVPAANPGETTDASSVSTGPATTINVNDKQVGVFMLPMKGMVGEGFRSNEIKKLAEHCDQYGPGQIIVLEIESGGGLGIEMEQIHYTIAEIRKRHRVVAWIKEAISAAAATASNCNEIYFYTTGTLGAMTGFAGGVSLQGEELQLWLTSAGNWMESGGRSRYIAEAMIDDEKLLSYDRDPVTGEVTWHNDLSGKVVLSDAKTNLVFTATTAMDSGFADGIADTPEQLAKLLNMPKWHEKDDYGRKISKEWLDTVDKAKAEIPLLFARYSYKGAAEGGKAKLGAQITIIKELIRWWDRCPNVCFLSNVPPKKELERQLEEMKRALARMN
jgi:ClpP class serine protease